MRVAVLDVGSNSVKLQIVDAYAGAPPLPIFAFRAPVRLAEALDERGAVAQSGFKALVDTVAKAMRVADTHGVGEVIAFATSALRDAPNGDDEHRQQSVSRDIDRDRRLLRMTGRCRPPGESQHVVHTIVVQQRCNKTRAHVPRRASHHDSHSTVVPHPARPKTRSVASARSWGRGAGGARALARHVERPRVILPLCVDGVQGGREL